MSASTGKILERPMTGLIAFTVALLSQWVGHTTWAFLRGAFGDWQPAASLVLGAVGVALIGLGLRKSELQATCMGFLGGLLVWVGWLELGFEYFTVLFALPEFTSPTGLQVNPGAAMLMSTAPIMLTIFFLYGLLNRETRCNLMRFVHRNTRLSPGKPTPNNGRSFARIAAMEFIFVTWACYLFWLYVGFMLNETLIMVAYVAWFIWFAYIFRKLLKLSRPGPALRYGIPVGIIGWGLGEMPSHMGFYPEVWLKPFEYPVQCVIAVTIFAGCLTALARWPTRQHRNPPVTT